jgi:trehalose synthase
LAGLWDYAEIVGKDAIEETISLAERLPNKSLLHVNSTAVGGGVAEILNRMVPLMKELGLDVRWDVIRGGEDFFRVTKSFHNALQGEEIKLTKAMTKTYLKYNEMNAQEINFDKFAIFIHDPQPAALIEQRGDNKWVWRCHIDISSPHKETWNFLKGYIEKYDASIFSMPSFSRPDLPIQQFMLRPSIDPLSEKNRDLSQDEIDKSLEKFDINPEAPIITQIGRFDRFKDPCGVIEAYKIVRRRMHCQLVLAGDMATDDPEGLEVFEEVRKKSEGDPDIHLLTSTGDIDVTALDINALQRASSVVLQKSLKEGFALTVSEALWKGKPVVGGAVGGIPAQIKNGITGYLVHSIEGAANATLKILRNPELAEKLGENGRRYVKRNFLLTRHLRDYLLVMYALQYPGIDFIQL